METPGKPGRVRSAPERKNPHRTTLRWSNVDYAKLLANVERSGMTVGSYIRSRVLDDIPTTGERRRGSVELVALAKALALVNKMGGNLHQLVRHLNFGGFPIPEEMCEALTGYEAMVAALMDAMGKQP
jgi:hypothetical protein